MPPHCSVSSSRPRLPAEVVEAASMTNQHSHHSSAGAQNIEGAHHSHRWMMVVCCIPVLVIAIVLVLTGIASPGFIVVALGCTFMMALMMRGMDHGGGGER